MNKLEFDVNNLRVAAPCSVGWERMTGDERVRSCDQCEMNVYNISTLTNAEIAELVKDHEGRLCVRLYKRADGTVLTKDCPVGIRAIRKRVGSFATAIVAAVLGLFSVSFGQKADAGPIDGSKISISRTQSPDEKGSFTITVRDSAGANISGVQIVLTRGEVRLKAKSNADGVCVFANIAEGTYNLTAKAKHFTKYAINDLKINGKENAKLQLGLVPADVSVIVGVSDYEPSIDIASSSVTTVISISKFESIPHEEF